MARVRPDSIRCRMTVPPRTAGFAERLIPPCFLASVLLSLAGCGRANAVKSNEIARRAGSQPATLQTTARDFAHHANDNLETGRDPTQPAYKANLSLASLESTPGCDDTPARSGSKPNVRLLGPTEIINSVNQLTGKSFALSELGWEDDRGRKLSSPIGAYVGITELTKWDGLTPRIAASLVSAPPSGAPACAEAQSDACVVPFVQWHGRRIFRRPVKSAESASFKQAYATARKTFDHSESLGLVLESMLQSTHFLTRVELGAKGTDSVAQLQRMDAFELASAVSFLLLRRAPDDTLLEDAASGRLDTEKGLEEVVDRLLKDPRAVEGVLDFYLRWMGAGHIADVEKDAKLFPDFTADARVAAHNETRAFVVRNALSPERTLADLLGDRATRIGGRLGPIYGVGTFSGEQDVTLPDGQRAGLLTQVSLLASNSKSNDTHPIRMGHMILDQLLCHVVPPPPKGAEAIPFTPDPGKTRRQNFDARTAGGTCVGCHRVLNPVSFAFDAYDPIGRHRTTLDGKPIDTSVTISGMRDVNGTFENVPAFVARLAQSEQVADCQVIHWMKFALGRELVEADACSLRDAARAFKASGYRIRALIAALAQTESFRSRRMP